MVTRVVHWLSLCFNFPCEFTGRRGLSSLQVEFTGCYYGLHFTGSNFVLTLCVVLPIRITGDFTVTLWGLYLKDKFTIEFIELVYGQKLRVVFSDSVFLSGL